MIACNIMLNLYYINGANSLLIDLITLKGLYFRQFGILSHGCYNVTTSKASFLYTCTKKCILFLKRYMHTHIYTHIALHGGRTEAP
jgi:hypothetical protein